MFKQTALLTFLALFSASNATIYFTSPVASTSGTGGQTLTIKWEDDGEAPSAASFGPSVIGIYAGGKLQQTLLQSFGTIDDPSKVLSVAPEIPKTLGPDSDQYFIRVTSVSAKDADGNALNAFSAKFSLEGMTGKFSPQVEAQISSLTSSATQTGNSGSSQTASTGAGTTSASSSSSKATTTATTTSAASQQNDNSAAPSLKVGGALFAAVASLAWLAL
ncbi:hypothetical protein BT69DRAFT_1356956 [Atractiella rhizophila]|nr:hypothetical protein BT69DRAFT_1356956 [Atractiella rhizophila]